MYLSLAWLGLAWLGLAWLGWISWFGLGGLVWIGLDWLVRFRFGSVQSGFVWFGCRFDYLLACLFVKIPPC